MIRCDLRTNTKKDMSLKEMNNNGKEYANHCMLISSQHDWENLSDYLMSTRIFTLIMNKISI